MQSTKRKGWLNHGIKGPESIADHMYRMSLMALIANDVPGINRERFELSEFFSFSYVLMLFNLECVFYSLFD